MSHAQVPAGAAREGPERGPDPVGSLRRATWEAHSAIESLPLMTRLMGDSPLSRARFLDFQGDTPGPAWRGFAESLGRLAGLGLASPESSIDGALAVFDLVRLMLGPEAEAETETRSGPGGRVSLAVP